MGLPMQFEMSLAKSFMAWAALAICTTSLVHGLHSNHPAHEFSGPSQPPINGFPEEFIASHNQARAAVGVKPLVWSQKLASLASRLVRYQRDKANCSFSGVDMGYGSNQELASYPRSPSEVVGTWVAEKKYYNYANNSCEPNHTCGVYTQVVWNTSLELGCGQASCAKGGSTLTMCLYNPPGNYEGQRPY